MAELSISGASIEEPDSSYVFLTFTMSLDAPATSSVEIPYQITGGTAVKYDDFSAQSSFFSSAFISAGATQTTVSVRANGDATAEADESVVLTVGPPVNATLKGGAAQLQTAAWILDDDSAGSTLGMFASDVAIVEGDSGTSRATFEVQLSRPAPSALSVPYSLVAGSADGSDFVAASGTISFGAGQRTAVVNADIRGDDVSEMNESFRLNLQPPSIVASTTGAQATIVDDDSGTVLPVIALKGEAVQEPDSSYQFATFTILLDQPAAASVTIPYRVIGGTALKGQDFDAQSNFVGNVFISAGDSQATVSVRVRGDVAPEGDDIVLIQLNTPVNALLPGGASVVEAPIFILDDDSAGAPALALHASNVSVDEGASGSRTASVDFTLSRPAPETITVPFALRSDSATLDSDVQAQSGSVTFLRGQTKASVAVELLGDLARETNETIKLGLSLPSTIGSAVVGAVTVVDDDSGLTQPSLTVEGESVAEFDSSYGFLTYVLRLDGPASTSLSVPYRVLAGTATEGTDYTAQNALVGTAFISAGATQTTVSIRAQGDVLGETDESVILEIDAPIGAQLPGGATKLQAAGFIVDNDRAGETLALHVLDAYVPEGDGSATQGVFELRLSQVAQSDLTISYQLAGLTATEGTDFAGGSGSVTIRRGENRAAIPFTVTGDRAVEDNETLRVNLVVPSQITSVSGGVATIVDNDEAIDGGETGDVLVGTSGPDNIRGFGGDDRLFGGDGDDFLDGGAGNDTLSGGGGRDTIDGGSGFDMVSYEEDGGRILAYLRRDLFRGADGVEDVVDGVEGAIGSPFADRLYAGNDGSRLEGRDGNDRLIGFGGDDTLLGGEGDDKLKPGAGDDSVDGGGGNDRILAGDGDDTILGGAGDDVILPGRGNDVIDGGDGDDIARGFRGDERISGGAGSDTLLGGLEDDTLIGGSGNDRLAGGPGRDTFLFDARGFGEDRIVDFRLGSDVIDFRGSGIRLGDLDLAVRGGNTVISVDGSSDEIVVGGVDLLGAESDAFLF